MPTEPPPSPEPGLHRRTALGALVALGAVTAGCTRQREQQAPAAPVRKPEEDPDVTLVRSVITAEQGVLDLVESVMQRHRDLRPLLTPTRDAHQAHIELLAAAVPKQGKASPSPSASASPSPTVAAPSRPARAVAVVVRAEDDLCLVDKRSAFAAQSGAFARILASMAASAAQQSAVLRRHPHAGAGR